MSHSDVDDTKIPSGFETEIVNPDSGNPTSVEQEMKKMVMTIANDSS